MKKRQALCRGQHFDMSHTTALTGGSVRGCPAFVPALVQCHYYCPPVLNVCCASRQTHTSANIAGFFKDNLLLPLKKKEKKEPTRSRGVKSSALRSAAPQVVQWLLFCRLSSLLPAPLSEASSLFTDQWPVRPALTLLNFPGLWWKTSLPAVTNHTPADVTTGLH